MVILAIVSGVAGFTGSRMGRTCRGWGRVLVSALVSAAVGLGAGFTLVMVLAGMLGVMPAAEGNLPIVLKALGLGIFFGGLMARNAQIDRPKPRNA